MTVLERLQALKTFIETDFPPILVNAGLDAIEEYVLGCPTYSEKSSLGFYLGVGDENDEIVNFKPVIQLQLPRVQYTDALEYFNLLNELIKESDPWTLDITAIDRLSYTEFPPDETGNTVFTFYVEYRKDLDDCD